MLDRVFGNRYRLVEKIGIGGMAEVYKATDEVLGRTVAVKVMLPQYATDPTFAARFKQEAQSAANLQSPYIVNIYDWGQDSADSTYYIVMEYVRGTDLKTAIQQRGAINPRKVAEIGSQVCAALSVAHGYDIIHRDIKPHNIMVQPDGNSKVMDFGIARASGSSMTQTGSVLGTAYYVSPEQAQGKLLTPATDLYSLGVVLYEATVGKVPFDAPDAVAVALKQVNEIPVPPSRLNPNIDPELERIILRAMSKNPLERFATAEQMRVALNNYLAGRPVDAGVVAPADTTRVMASQSSLPIIGSDGAAPARTAVMPNVVSGQVSPAVRAALRAKEADDRKKKQRVVIFAVIASIVCIAAIIAFVVFLQSGEKTTIDVPNVVGKTEAEARTDIEALGLTVGEVKREASDKVETDHVISSDPSAKEKVEAGTKINLVVSSGVEPPKQVEVPDLTNATAADAAKKLRDQGLTPAKGADEFHDTIDAGKVCRQDVAAGTMVDEKTTVTYIISKGKESGSLPYVIGMPEADAIKALEDAGYFVGEVTYEYNDDYGDYSEGQVLYQNPTTGNVEKGTYVNLVISQGPAPIEVPNVVGLTIVDAKAKIRAAGFTDQVYYNPVTDASKNDIVLAQDPVSGNRELGTVIIIEVGDYTEPTTPTTPTNTTIP